MNALELLTEVYACLADFRREARHKAGDRQHEYVESPLSQQKHGKAIIASTNSLNWHAERGRVVDYNVHASPVISCDASHARSDARVNRSPIGS
jgi:hypothetical protein